MTSRFLARRIFFLRCRGADTSFSHALADRKREREKDIEKEKEKRSLMSHRPSSFPLSIFNRIRTSESKIFLSQRRERTLSRYYYSLPFSSYSVLGNRWMVTVEIGRNDRIVFRGRFLRWRERGRDRRRERKLKIRSH